MRRPRRAFQALRSRWVASVGEFSLSLTSLQMPGRPQQQSPSYMVSDGEDGGALYRAELAELQKVGCTCPSDGPIASRRTGLGSNTCCLWPLQALPPRCYTGEDTAAWLRDSLLTLRLADGNAAADVAGAGEPPAACSSAPSLLRLPLLHPLTHPSTRATVGLSWQPRYVRPTLWEEPSPTRTAVEPLLPDSLAGGEIEGEGPRAGSALGFREVFLEGDGYEGVSLLNLLAVFEFD